MKINSNLKMIIHIHKKISRHMKMKPHKQKRMNHRGHIPKTKMMNILASLSIIPMVILMVIMKKKDNMKMILKTNPQWFSMGV